MKLADAISEAYDRKWSMINTFTVQINMPTFLVELVGNFERDLNLNIISFTTPDFTNTPIETFVAGKWVIHNGRDELYRFSITFRDHDQLSLYKKFLKIYNASKDNYFDDIALSVILTKDADWASEEDLAFGTFDGTMVENVSNLSFSNDTENQIAEFTVSFKCNKPTI